MLYWLKYVLVPLICFFSLQHFPVVSSIGGIDITTFRLYVDIIALILTVILILKSKHQGTVKPILGICFQNEKDFYSQQRGAAAKHQRHGGGCQEEKEEDWVDAKAWVEILPKTLYIKNWKTRWYVFQFKFKYQVFGLLCSDIAHLCVWNCVSQLKL